MSQRTFGKLGRLKAERPVGLHALAYYQSNPLPVAPSGVVVPTPAGGWGMCGNDVYGDCTIAGAVHADVCTAAALGTTGYTPPTLQVVEQQYLTLSPNDQGCVEATVLKDWQSTGLFNSTSKLAAYAPTDKSDFQELQSVIASYGLVYIGINLPAPSEQQFRAEEPWVLTNTPADENILGGHCIILVGYNASYVYGITWGQVQAIAWSWLESYMDESWAIITQGIVQAGAYGNLNLTQLQTDIGSL